MALCMVARAFPSCLSDNKLVQENNHVFFCLFGLRLYVPVNNFSVMLGRLSRGGPVLSNEDEVSCSRTQHPTPGEI